MGLNFDSIFRSTNLFLLNMLKGCTVGFYKKWKSMFVMVYTTSHVCYHIMMETHLYKLVFIANIFTNVPTFFIYTESSKQY